MRAIKATQYKRRHAFAKDLELDDNPSRPLFAASVPLRRLRVIVDVDSLPEPLSEQDDLLRGLLKHDTVSLLNYSDDGPPTEVDVIGHGWHTASLGWITVAEARDQYTYASDPDKVTGQALRMGDFERIAAEDTRSLSYRDLAPDEAVSARVRDYQLWQVAEEWPADLLITKRPYLFESQYGLLSRSRVAIMKPEDALPVVGLYLRTQGEYLVHTGFRDSMRLKFNRGLMFWVASRSLLHEGWRWMGALVQEGQAAQDDLLTYYAGTAHQRLERALRARDEIFVWLNQPQNNDTADDALAAFDTLLISLVGAVDVVARVLNLTFEESDNPRNVGWARSGWRRRLRRETPEIFDETDHQTPYGDLLLVLGALRNTIHGAALQAMAVSSDSDYGHTGTVLGLPQDELDRLLDALGRLGGLKAWGVRTLIPGRAHAELDQLLEQLLSRTVDFLNYAMRATPVERFANFDRELRRPAGDEFDDPFSDIRSRYVLMQMGLIMAED